MDNRNSPRNIKPKDEEKKGNKWLLWLAFMGVVGLAGYQTWNNLNLKKGNRELKNANMNLKTKIHNDSMRYSDSCYSLQVKLENKTDTLNLTDSLYKEKVVQNKNLNNQIKQLKRTITGLEKALEKSEGLEDERFKVQFAKLREEYVNALKDSMSLDSAKYAALETRFNNLNDLYKKAVAKKSDEVSNAYWSAENQDEYIRNLESKDKRWIHNWKFIKPRLYDWGSESISAIDNDPEDMYAFAVFEQGKKIPLTRIGQSKKTAIFGWGPDIRNFEGSFEVYFYDKNGNESSMYEYEIKEGIISQQ